VTPFFFKQAVNALCDALVEGEEDEALLPVLFDVDFDDGELPPPHAAAPRAVATMANPTPIRRGSFDFRCVDIAFDDRRKGVILYSALGFARERRSRYWEQCRSTLSASGETPNARPRHRATVAIGK
jgi:hypothetical protein